MFEFGEQAESKTYKQLGNAINIGAAYHVFREHVLRDQEDIAATLDGSALVQAVLTSSDCPLLTRPIDDVGVG